VGSDDSGPRRNHDGTGELEPHQEQKEAGCGDPTTAIESTRPQAAINEAAQVMRTMPTSVSILRTDRSGAHLSPVEHATTADQHPNATEDDGDASQDGESHLASSASHLLLFIVRAASDILNCHTPGSH